MDPVVKGDFLHTINKVVGIAVQDLCPKCGSTEWYARKETISMYKIYSNGDVICEDADNMWLNRYCFDCEHED